MDWQIAENKARNANFLCYTKEKGFGGCVYPEKIKRLKTF